MKTSVYAIRNNTTLGQLRSWAKKSDSHEMVVKTLFLFARGLTCPDILSQASWIDTKKAALLKKGTLSSILAELFDAGIIEKRTTIKAIGEPDEDDVADEKGHTQEAAKLPQSNT